MASIQKRSVKVNGKTYRPGKWYVRYRDTEGKEHRLAAFTDKRASTALANRIDQLVECRAENLPPPADLRTALDALPERICEHLRGVGLLDNVTGAGSRPLADHLDTWADHLRAKGDCEQHVSQRIGRTRRTLDAAGADWWDDINPDRVEAALADLRAKRRLSVSTVNAYRGAVKAFCRWMWRTGRAPEHPLRHLSRENPKGRRRRRRRALTPAEAAALIAAAADSPGPEQGCPPRERALLYRTALETGLRFSELQTLKARHLALGAEPPTLTVEGAYSKSGRTDTLPLRPALAGALREHCRHKMPEAPVFAMWKNAKGARMVKPDLRRAKVEYRDASGRYADFHSLRVTFITNLAKAGVHPRVAQELARHSTMDLTMQVYTHVALDSKESAVAGLPDLEAQGARKAHGG